ncbi:hypothetical protein D3C80_1322530 [compost metagenome]
MADAGHHQIDQVVECNQTATVLQRPERQRNTLAQPAHHRFEVGLDPGAIDQYRANDHHFQTRFPGQRLQCNFGFELGDAVGILRLRLIVGSIGLSGFRAFAIDLDRTDEDEALDPSGDGLPCECQGSIDIDLAEGAQRIGFGIIHDMYASRAMNDHLTPFQCPAPCACLFERFEANGLHRCRQ